MSPGSIVLKRMMADFYKSSLEDGEANVFEAFISARDKRDSLYKLCYLLGKLDSRFCGVTLVQESLLMHELSGKGKYE